jgi:transcriptional regulator with XRE-family HTH domain
MARDGVPHGIDLHVGFRVRQRRKQEGMSQDTLATQLGLTFQQIQKYERGTNRISASKLHDISIALKVSIEYFFAGYGDGAENEGFVASASEETVSRFLSSAEGIELAEIFPRVKNPKWRRRIVELAKTISDEAGDQ